VERLSAQFFRYQLFAMNWTILTNIANQWIIHANALASLGDEASPIAKSFVAEYGGDLLTMPPPIAMALTVSGFLIAFLPLWMQPKK